MNKLVLTSAIALLVAGCGGGGGSDTSKSTTQSAPPQPVVQTQATCTNPHNADYPANFAGPWPTPNSNLKLNANIVRSAGFKDYYAGMYSNRVKSNCTSDEYTKLMYIQTLDKMKELGVQRAWIYNFSHWEDASANNWTTSRKNWEVPESVMTFIVTEARKRNIEIYLSWQYSIQDYDGDKLFSMTQTADETLVRKIMDAYEPVILDVSKYAESVGIAGISLDWNAMYVRDMHLYNNYINKRFSKIADGIKSNFKGKLVFGQFLIPQYDEELWNKVDMIMVEIIPRLEEIEAINMSVENVEAATLREIENKYKGMNIPYGYTKPIIIKVLIQSHKNFFREGWIEDGFCVEGVTSSNEKHKCIQETYTTDFSVQAVGLEGMMRAINSQSLFKVESVDYNSLWLTDTLQPGIEGFPNLSQSVRGKPAEKVLKQWFSR
jgi:hypothetical protein